MQGTCGEHGATKKKRKENDSVCVCVCSMEGQPVGLWSFNIDLVAHNSVRATSMSRTGHPLKLLFVPH